MCPDILSLSSGRSIGISQSAKLSTSPHSILAGELNARENLFADICGHGKTDMTHPNVCAVG